MPNPFNTLLARLTSPVGGKKSQEARGVGIENTPAMLSLLNMSEGNVRVDDITVVSIPALTRAIEIVANAVAKLPIQVFTRRQGVIREMDDHPISFMCNVSPNDEQTPFAFWWAMVCNAFLAGGGGAEIVRDEIGNPTALRLMRHGCTAYKTRPEDPLRYWDNELGKLFFPEDVIYLPGIMLRDGFLCRPLAHVFKNTFGEPLAQTLLANTLYKQGVYPSAVYSYTGIKGNPRGDEALSRDISRYFGGLEKAGMVLPIPNMDKFTQLKPISAVDSQLMDARKWTIAEISRITGVPPDMLGEGDKQSYAYSEMSAKAFIQYTLDPWITKRDQELRKKLLKEGERTQVHVETHVDETMWMLPKDRVDYWWKLFQMGALSPDEIRSYLNMNPIEGGDKRFVQVNLAPLTQIENIHANGNANQ